MQQDKHQKQHKAGQVRGSVHTGPGTPASETMPDTSGAARFFIGLVLAAVLGFGIFGLGGGTDNLSSTQIQQRSADFAEAGTILLPAVPADKVGQSIAAMGLSDYDKEQLASAVDSGSSRLVYLTLWDTHAEDGDQVIVSSDGYAQQITIMNKPYTIAVPEPVSGVISLQGTGDGGGGITIGIVSGSTQIPLPYMTPGQTIGIPVAGGG